MAAQTIEAHRRRFLRKTLRVDNGCLEWLGDSSSNGYGRFGMYGRRWYAHRAAYHLFVDQSLPVGEGWAGRCVLHVCDNRLCVDPFHLRYGTKQDNSRDMIAKGRGWTPWRGERNKSAKLTEDDVREIRNLLAGGAKQKDLCSRYGISTGAMSAVATRQHWRHVV